MKRRSIRLRPVRKAEIDLRRLAAAIATMAAEEKRQQSTAASRQSIAGRGGS